MKLIPVPADQVDKVWEAAKPYIAKACEISNGLQTPESALDQIKNHCRQLWLIVTDDKPHRAVAAGLTSIQTYPTGKKLLQIEALGGERMKDWFDLKETFEDWAKAEGCSGVIAWTRKGWAKELPDYKLTRYVMYKEFQ